MKVIHEKLHRCVDTKGNCVRYQRFFKDLQSLRLVLLLLPALFCLVADFLLGEISKSSNVSGRFEGEGVDGVFLGLGRVGTGGISGGVSDSTITRKLRALN